MDFIPFHFYFLGVSALFCLGLYLAAASPNLIKKLLGLLLFQASVMLFFISLGKISGGRAPIISEKIHVYANPLPHVLILTAIVVSLATLAVGLALAIRISREFGSIEDES